LVRFVFPHQSILRSSDRNAASHKSSSPSWDSYWALLRAPLPRSDAHALRRGKVNAAFRVGEFWNKQARSMSSACAKMAAPTRRVQMGGPGPLKNLSEDLLEKGRHFPNTRQATIHRISSCAT